MSCIPINDFSLISLCDATKAGKLYSIVPDDGSGDFDVARNSTATYLGADGLIKTAAIDEPRIEFNPDGSYKGLLVEPQRTNLLLRSEEFDDAYWSKLGTTTPTISANAITSPTGELTADLLTGTGGAGMRVQRTVTVTTAAHTFSFFVKENTETAARLNIFDGSTDRGATFTFSSESFTSISAGLTATFQELPNGWYRLNVAYPSFASTSINIQIQVSGTLSYYIWGAQLEAASTASSYIPTVASTVTRVADVISNDLSALVTGDYSMVLDVEANVGRLKVFEALTGFEVDLTGSGRMVVTVDTEITLHFPDGRTLEFLKPNNFVDLEFITKVTSNHIKVVATLNRIITQSEIDGLTSGNLNSPLLDTGAVTNFSEKYRNLNYDFFGKIDTSSGTNFLNAWRDNNLTSFPLIDTSSGTNFFSTWFSNNLTSFPLIGTSSGTNFQSAWHNNNLEAWPANMFDTCPATNFTNCWFNNALDQQGVDNILVSINKAREDGFSGSNGTLGISGGTNATPGAAGQAAADALRADGWTVNLNGY